MKPREPRASQIWRRTPSSAARHAAAHFGEIVGERPDTIWARPKGARRVQLLRHLVAHFLREELGYRQVEIAGALEKDRATVRHSLLAVWRMREDANVDALIVRVRAAWVDPVSAHVREYARRQVAFSRAFDKLVLTRGRLQDEDLAVALAAAGAAVTVRQAQEIELSVERTPAASARAQVSRHASASDVHPAAAILGQAPAIRSLIGEPSFDQDVTRSGGVRLSITSQTTQGQMERATKAAAQILEASGFHATTEGVFEGQGGHKQGGWRAVLRVAPARVMGLGAALALVMAGPMVMPDMRAAAVLEAI